MILETNRLLMRPFQVEDAAGMFLLNNDPEVIQYTGDPPFESIEHAQDFILNYRNYEKPGYGRLSVLLKSTHEYLGWCGLSLNETTNETDIGFRFQKRYWNKGYATEAATASLQYGFQLGLSKIIGRAVKENQASIRVLIKIGMQFEHEFFAHGFTCEQYYINSNDKH
jgi:[ribosomal protein S5]-alanine N-acetyltransferase